MLVHVTAGPGIGNGLQVEFEDIVRGYTSSHGHSQWCVPIEPGKMYEVWRHFTSGNKNYMACAYQTPQEPGTYTLRVNYYGIIFEPTTQITVEPKAAILIVLSQRKTKIVRFKGS